MWSAWSELVSITVGLFGLLIAASANLSRAGQADYVEIFQVGGTNTGHSLESLPPDAKPIVLEIPDEFRYGSSRRVSRAWGLNILTFYPGFTSPTAPENAKFTHSCVGDCNGRMLISIENKRQPIHNPSGTTNHIDYPNMGDAIAHSQIENPIFGRGAEKIPLGPQDGFDSGFETHAPSRDANSEQIHKYLFHLSPDRVHYDLAAECQLNKFAKTCRLHFSLKCNPAIYVQVVAIDMRHIDQFADVVAKTDAFVSSMVRRPECEQG